MKEVTEGDILVWVSAVIAAVVGWVIRVVYTRTSDHIDALELRVQAIERSTVEEHKVRQLILDAVLPIKASQEEIKNDLNRILDILMRHDKP